MKKAALITGASGGIGLELARIHASEGGDLILVARRLTELERIKAELQQQYKVEILILSLDLSEAKGVNELISQLEGRDIVVEYLFNNAGTGGHGLFTERSPEEDERMINLNMLALTRLTRQFLPDMIRRGKGKILNVGSSAAFMPGPLQAQYFATKAYVRSLSLALSEELRGTGVTITTLSPGPVKTDFAKSAGMEDALLFKFSDKAEFVARLAYKAMKKGRREVIPNLALALMLRLIVPVVPNTWLLRIVRKAQELKP
jgi:uncharacterized protein